MTTKLAESAGNAQPEVKDGLVRPAANAAIGRNCVIRVLLLHGGPIPHYRVPVYNYLSHYLAERSFALTVTAEQIQSGTPTKVELEFVQMPLSVASAISQ